MAKRKGSGEVARPASELPRAGDTTHGDTLMDWTLRGYHLSELMIALKGAREEHVPQIMKDFSAKIHMLEALRREFQAALPPEKLSELEPMFVDPSKIPELERRLSQLKYEPKTSELRAELATLNTKGFEREAEAIKKALEDPRRLNEAEMAIGTLKKKIKEKFFEQEFAVQLESRPAPSSPGLMLDTIVVMHKDGTLLAVKSKKPKEELDKRFLSKAIVKIREAALQYPEGATLDVDGTKFSIQPGAYVCVALSFHGEEPQILRRVLKKVTDILERKHSETFKTWTGDRSRLFDIDKYPTAIFQALEKVE
ncbi:MAG: hypothetical protein HZB92_02050 [Euryarchaeota archaeon]|nr:hypothetical protein [Euryarchaeota archaeon]